MLMVKCKVPSGDAAHLRTPIQTPVSAATWWGGLWAVGSRRWVLPKLLFFSGQGVPVPPHCARAELGEVTRLEKGRVGRRVSALEEGIAAKTLELGGKTPKDYAGGQQPVSEGGAVPSAPLCHDGVVGPVTFLLQSSMRAPFSSRGQRRRRGGRGPPPSMAMAASASPSTTRE